MEIDVATGLSIIKTRENASLESGTLKHVLCSPAGFIDRIGFTVVEAKKHNRFENQGVHGTLTDES